jgi:hypothetical protein
MYRENVDMIVEECDRDMMALERAEPAQYVYWLSWQSAEIHKAVAADPRAGAAIHIRMGRLDVARNVL